MTSRSLSLACLVLLSGCSDPGSPDPKDSGMDSALNDTEETSDSEDSLPQDDFHCLLDQEALRDSVSQIALGGSLPSALIVFGEEACPVVVDDSGRSYVASARFGEGRALEIGHEGILGGSTDKDITRFLLNAMSWAGSSEKPRVGVSSSYPALRGLLEEQGLEASIVYPSLIEDVADLADYDVFVTDVYTNPGEHAQRTTQDWVSQGGGLIVAGHAWYYGPDYEDPAREYPGNVLLGPMGIIVTTATAASGTYSLAAEPPGELHHHTRALELLSSWITGGGALEDEEVLLGATTATFAASELPVSFDAWWTKAGIFLDHVPPVVPSREDPIRPATQPVEALALALESRLALESDAIDTWPLPSALEFPGSVEGDPPDESFVLSLDASNPGRDGDFWYASPGAAMLIGTGRYAGPAEIVTLELPAAWVDQGLGVQIGIHSDQLWDLPSWSRAPEIVRWDPIDATHLELASGFGGPIYITIPVGVEAGVEELSIEGSRPMPSFTLGETPPETWARALEESTVAWVELRAPGIVLTAPRSWLAEIDDPTSLMELWQEILSGAAWLAGEDRVRDERIVLDTQISAGWMHSGYPVMGYLESTSELTDLDTLLSEGAWGPLHELGHNHQLGPANLPGTTEATCNLWSVYLSETRLGLDRSVAHSALSAESRAATLAAYIDGGRNFEEDWSVWTALETYLQLQEAFGWEFLATIHTDYLAMASGERPSSDPERIDTWAVRSSRAVGMNLSDFYLAWGWPLSEDAILEIADLPPWTEHPLAGH